jgi:hypothetical protein
MSKRLSSRVRAVLLLALGVGLAGSNAAAAQPTEAQQSAIRSACQSDYRAHCGSVPAGGSAALDCLQKNLASLSPSCQGAVGAVGAVGAAAATQAAPTQPAPAQPPPAEATSAPPAPAAQPTEAQQSAIRSACQSDYRAHCASVPAGGSAALQCLQRNLAGLSPSCQGAVKAVGGTAASNAAPPDAAAAGAAPAGSTAPAAQKVVVLSPRQEMALMREACGRDYQTLCPGIRIVGGGARQCLANHAAALSPACRSELAKLGPRP